MSTTLVLLKEHRMQEALAALRPALADGSHWELTKEFTDICNTYHYLLDYFRQGVTDTERERVFTQLAGRLLVLEDRLEICTRQGSNPGFGTPTLWTSGDAAHSLEIFRSSDSVNKKCLMLSDMTLSLLVVFDPLKIPVLCEAAASATDEVAIRAITALDLMIRCHADRLPFYPETTVHLRQLFGDTLYADMLADVELQLSRSLDTERIERQMRDEIIPAMLRNPMSPFNPAKGIDGTTPPKGPMSPFTDDISINPDWEEWMEKSGIKEKMRELTEMQMNGADVYMATFAQMKTYPFFNSIENWFRPFDPTNNAVSGLFPAGEEGEPTLQRLVMRSDIFCNSDKYSFCLALNQLPAAQRDLLRDQIREQKDALDEEVASSLNEAIKRQKGKPTTKTLTRQYMQDLYRFFHLCPRRHNYINPFDNAFVHDTLDRLADIIVLPAKCLCAMAELDIQRKNFEGADTLFSFHMLYHPQKMDATLWQKAGYCRQMAKRYNTAIEALAMSDVLMPEHPWTMLHLAQCYRKNGDDERALEYYKYVEKASPNDMRVLWQEARLLMRLQREEEALPLLQRLAYEEPDTQKIMSLLTEAYLRVGRIEQAVKQVDRMMALPNVELVEGELFTSACAYWLAGRREEALTLFQHIGSFDMSKALAIGIPKEDISFLRDLIVSLNG